MEFSEIKGFGKKRIEYLRKSGIENVNDLLAVFPRTYIDLTASVSPSQAADKDRSSLHAFVFKPAVVKYIRKGLFMTVVSMMSDDSEEFECTWFNRKYIKNTLAVGKRFYVVGKVEKFGRKYKVSNPDLIADSESLPKIYPIYRPIKGIPASVFLSAIDTVLEKIRISGYIGNEISDKYGLMKLDGAMKEIHRPSNMISLENARRSVAIENLSCNLALYSIVKKTSEKRARYRDKSESINSFINRLPFALTSDQIAAIDDILSDMSSDKRMNRLLQGDVGCGKTVIALTAIYYAALNGYQSVLMSPTEILARQHYETARRIMSPYGIDIAFLSSSVPDEEKRSILERTKSGDISVLIGTHALIQEDVVFGNLSLIVTDEQQRFGVQQRGLLENKASGADCLVMSATPIPRTIALTLYGDLDQSEIHTMPARKAKILTRFVPQSKLNDMLDYVKEKADSGQQTFMVCPRVADDELTSVNSLYEQLSKTELKPYVGMLHGQQSDEEKERTMRNFSAGDIPILIATSIIEVGIDVPNATTMIIFDAERFGLSQLHQLRGRVGRGSTDSYCFLLSDATDNEKVKARLEYFIGCDDGFKLAEYDFKIRGAGDFLGTRQHGESIFSALDSQTIEISRDISAELCKDGDFRRNILKNTARGQISFIENLTLN